MRWFHFSYRISRKIQRLSCLRWLSLFPRFVSSTLRYNTVVRSQFCLDYLTLQAKMRVLEELRLLCYAVPNLGFLSGAGFVCAVLVMIRVSDAHLRKTQCPGQKLLTLRINHMRSMSQAGGCWTYKYTVICQLLCGCEHVNFCCLHQLFLNSISFAPLKWKTWVGGSKRQRCARIRLK